MGTVAEVRSDLCEASAGEFRRMDRRQDRRSVPHCPTSVPPSASEEVETARRKAVMTAETCPQYLLLTSGVYEGPQETSLFRHAGPPDPWRQ